MSDPSPKIGALTLKMKTLDISCAKFKLMENICNIVQ